MKFVGSIRDPVYGLVPITDIEQEILKLPLMNRLKDIKQLGLAYLAFSGANHTRFEHSVGAMHVAHLMATGLGIENELETVRIAALLHDVGHPPFSHSIEFAARMFGIREIPDHKKVTRSKIIEDERLKEILVARPLVHLEDVADLAVGKFSKAPYLSQIIDSGVDADKIDYILRDNHHCGFPVALDINTLIHVFAKDKKKRGIVIKTEGQSLAEQLFIGRYHLVSNIHHNTKNRLGNYLLALTLEEAWQNTEDKKSTSAKMTRDWTDGDLMRYLEEKAPKRFEILKNLLLGGETFHEVMNFGYGDLSPLGRYSAATLSYRRKYLPKISNAFSKRIKDKEFFIDAYVASPPEPSVIIGEKIPNT